MDNVNITQRYLTQSIQHRDIYFQSRVVVAQIYIPTNEARYMQFVNILITCQ